MAFPDSSAVGVTQDAVPLGSFSGSVYGGHAPIVGSHVFVLQASVNGYGSPATSLLLPTTQSANGSGGYAVNKETNTAYGTQGMGYVTTDMYGDFNISGEYTCTPGLPVYLYGTGGTSEVLPNSPISGGTVTATGTTTGTINFTSNNLLSIGQQVTFATISATGGNAATLANALDNTTNVYTVTAATTSTFSVTGNVPAVAPITGGTVVLANVTNINPAIGQLAVLGLCPTGTGAATNFGALSYVYMNEVSTVAAAYALGGFMTDPNGPNGSLHSVNATYLSIPIEGGNPLTANTISSITPPTVAAAKLSPAWVGLQNATLNAAQIYNIQGAGAISTPTNGEGHVANATSSTGGTVSQALVNAIANSLAACVDSGNTAASPSNPCLSLLSYALPTSSGVGGNVSTSSSPTMSGTAPVETATAAINFAHNPWNPDVSNIIALPNQAAPYSPTVTSAQDLAVTITYPMTGMQSGGDGGIAIDQLGNAWVSTYLSLGIAQLSPQGKLLWSNVPSLYRTGMVAIDSTGSGWLTLRDNLNAFGTVLEGAYKYSNTGAISNGGNPYGYVSSANPANTAYNKGLFDNIWVTIDNGDAAWFPNHVFNNTLVLTSDGTVTTSYSSGVNPGPGVQNMSSSTYDGPFANAFDISGALWMTVNNGQFNNVTRFAPGGGSTTNPAGYFGSYSDGNGGALSNGTINDPLGLAVDNGGNVWVASGGVNNGTYTYKNITATTVTNSYYKNGNNLYMIPAGGTGSVVTYNGSNNGLQNSTGVAIDGNGMIFVSCPGYTWNSKTFQSTGLGSTTSTGLGDIAVMNSNTSNFVTGSAGLTGTYVKSGSGTVQPMAAPYFMAVDNAGNLWVNTNTTVVEYMGMATPVLTPLSANLNGTKGTAQKP